MKRIFLWILSAALLLGTMNGVAFAAEQMEKIDNTTTAEEHEVVEITEFSEDEVLIPSSEGMEKIVPAVERAAETRAVATMKTSNAGIAFIESLEGFVKYAYWDYSQYSIGYGSHCDPNDYPNGITQAEADALLREQIGSYESSVNSFAQKHGLSFSQNQFDALVSFTYNLGSGWTSGCKMVNAILNGSTELEFVTYMGLWCNAGGSPLAGLCARRIKEAQLYMYGSYDGATGAGGTACQQYTYLIFQPNGGSVSSRVAYYRKGSRYGNLPIATRDGYTLAGWYDAIKNTRITYATSADENRTVKASWLEGSNLSVDNGCTISDPNGWDVCDIFIDVEESDWFYDAVAFAYENELMTGTSNSKFDPNLAANRAMFVTILYRHAGSPDVSGSTPFTDLLPNAYYNDAILWAYQKGIVTGKTAAQFGPEDQLTREQLTAILQRYTNLQGYSLTKTQTLTGFPDGSQVSQYAVGAMQWAVGNGLITGTVSGKLMPQGPATRAQVATILQRFVQTIG